MKLFNLEEYLKNPSKKVITRDGKDARIICTDRRDLNFPIVALVAKELRKGETARYYTKDGKFYITGSCDFDLFFATEKHEGWINIYHNSEGAHYVMVCPIFESKEEAEKTGKRYINYMATIKIEWEE